MSRRRLLTTPPAEVERALKRLGPDLRTARLRHNITLADVAERIGARREVVGDAYAATLVDGLPYTDDHPRKPAAIGPGPDGRLSPAYDLTPTPALAEARRDLAMTCGARRGASPTPLLSEFRRFLLEPEAAAALIDQMQAAVRQPWYGVARSCRVSEAHCEAIRRAYVYPGFRA